MKQTILTGIIALLVALPVAAQTYRWVDSNGQVHYSSEPPQGQTVEAIKTPTAIKIDNRDINAEQAEKTKTKTEADKQAVLNKQAQEQAAKDDAQLKQACNGMRQDLALYQNQPRARIDVEGVTRRLTPEELNKRIADLQKTINDNCQNY